MPWIGALIGAGAGLYGNSRSRKAQADQLEEARKAQEAGQGNVQGLESYRGIGNQALESLAELMALPGYRTPSERALRTLKAPDRNSYYSGGGGGDTKMPIRGISVPGGFKVGGTSGIGLKRSKGKDEQVSEPVFNTAQYEADIASYNALKSELEAKRDEELSRFNPTSRLEQTPGYQFRYNTGLNQVANTQASRNRALSGRAIKELSDYGQGAASQEYGQEYNRLANIAGMGQTSATNMAQFGINQGTSLANLAKSQGNVNADYYSNLNNTLQGSLANYQFGRMTQRKPGGQTPYDSSQTPYDSSFGSIDPNSAAGSQEGQAWWNS